MVPLHNPYSLKKMLFCILIEVGTNDFLKQARLHLGTLYPLPEYRK